MATPEMSSFRTILHPLNNEKAKYPSEVFDTEYNINVRYGSRRYSERTRWESRKHLITSAVCYSMGIAGWWRFPTFAYRYDGGTFLLAYTFLMILIGHPLLYFEIVLGQVTSRSPNKVFTLCPVFEGVGLAMALESSYMALYFGVLCAYTCMYMFSTISQNFVWMNCGNLSCWNKTMFNSTLFTPELYFYKTVMGIKKDTGDSMLSNVHWPVVAFLFVIWIFVYICISIDIRSSSLLVTILLIATYMLVLPLLLATQLAEGASKGLKKLFCPSFGQMANLELWCHAMNHVLFSLALAAGPTISFGSCSQFMTPIRGTCFIICILVLSLSIITGIIIFNTLGFIAHDSNSNDLFSTIRKGPGSVYVLYSVAFTKLPFQQAWAFTTYFTATFLAIFTMSIVLEIVMSVICNQHEKFRANRSFASAVISGVLFLFSLPATTKIGRPMIMILDEYPIGMGLSLIAVCEISYVVFFGINDISNLRLFKFGRPFLQFYKYSLYYIYPILIATIIMSFIPQESSVFSLQSMIAGWILYGIVILVIVIKAIYNFIYFFRKGNTMKLFKARETFLDDTVPRFSNAPPPVDRPKLVPSPTESQQFKYSSNFPQAGPSKKEEIPLSKRYWQMPSGTYDITETYYSDEDL